MTPEQLRNEFKALIWKTATDFPHFSAIATIGEIAEKKYTLSVSNYVEPEDTREEIDIDALNQRISSIVTRENELRAQIDDIIAKIIV